MKKLLVGLMCLVGFGAQAADTNASFSSTVASYCTLGLAQPGTMHFNGNVISTDSAAIVAVQNNEAATYKIQVANAGDFSGKPNGYTGTATLTNSFVTTGANPTSGDVAAGVGHNLDNIGSDTMSISIAGTATEDMISGSYEAIAVASCIAQ